MAQTRKRTMILTNTNKRYVDTLSVYFHKTSPSLEDSYVTIQSSSTNSFSSDSQEIRHSHRYIKHSKLNRNHDYVTSLKRRVRRQQSINDQNQTSNSRSPSTTNLYSISYSKQPVTSFRYRSQRSKSVVPLPALIPNARVVQTQVRGIKRNMSG